MFGFRLGGVGGLLRRERVLPRLMVTVHGFLASRWNSMPLGASLLAADPHTTVAAFGYSSRSEQVPLASHGADLLQFIEDHARCLGLDLASEADGDQIGVCTHSMGGVVLGAALAQGRGLCALQHARVVMVAPPLRGSMWAKYVLETGGPMSELLVRGAGAELAAMADDPVKQAEFALPPSLRLAIVTGEKSWSNPVLSHISDGQPHDGTILNSESVPPSSVVPYAHVHLPGAGHSLLNVRRDMWGAAKAHLSG